MIEPVKINTLFLDIGGVLLTNGWDHHARRRAVDQFQLNYDEMNERHHLTFDTYEVGKLSLDEYLKRVVFYQEQSFTPDDFKRFMYSQSKPLPEMIQFIGNLKDRYNLRTFAVSNEGRELTEHRIKTFKLKELFDGFICSCYVHFRKPDEDIYQLAMDISQASPENVAYLDDRALFVEIAGSLGIHGILHKDLEKTRNDLAALGLRLSDSD
jgi:putative hydrolase of the HAD superfamily